VPSRDGRITLNISAPLLGLGLTMTGIGTILLLLSFKPRDEGDEGELRSTGIIFLGLIPLAFGGRGMWAIVGIAIVVMIFIFVAAAMAQPEILRL
jgi:uncharacterized membrane protein